MKFNLKTILIIVVAIIVLVVIFSFTSVDPKVAEQEKIKKTEIDNVFNIWMNIAGSGDQLTLTQNEAAVKKDLYDKLNAQEIVSLKSYSTSLQNLLSVKNKPFDPLFLSSLAYLTTNFNTTKAIVDKTNAKNIFANFGLPKKTA